MELSGNWNYPTQIRFGCGRVTELPTACAEAGIARPLLVTDRGLGDLPITRQVLSIMAEALLAQRAALEESAAPF